MSATKQFYFEIAELAFKLEANIPDRETALRNWNKHTANQIVKYAAVGEQMWPLMSDIYDQIADRNGDYWEFFADGFTWEQLEKSYGKKTA